MTDHQEQCKKRLQAIQDTSEAISGKWKIRILACLSMGSQNFMELQRRIIGIRGKMLSQELRDLETNGLIIRTVCDTRPITVNYQLTEYGYTLRGIIEEMERWGYQHRNKVAGRPLQ